MQEQLAQILRKTLEEQYPMYQLELTVDERGIAFLSGLVDCWDDVVDIGLLVGRNPQVVNVVNDLVAAGIAPPRKDYAAMAAEGRAAGLLDEVDVVIVGAGICGCGIARELARYDLRIAVAEAKEDVATGATRANNGDIHPRNKIELGERKFEYCLRGNYLYSTWAKELGFALKREGYLYMACTEKHMELLRSISSKPWFARIPGARLLDAQEVKSMEPLLCKEGEPRIRGGGSVQVMGAISYPTGGSVDPYQVAVALGENAVANGVRFYFDAPVAAIDREDGRITSVVTRKGVIRCRYVINCAGVYADDLAEMAGDKYFTIHGRKGTLAVFDKAYPPRFNAIPILMSDVTDALKASKTMKNSKGGDMDRTVENNVLIGSSAKEVWDKEDTSAERSGMDYILALNNDPDLPPSAVIRYFSGVRAANYKEDFTIEASQRQPDFINVAGIQSPGLTSAPAIAQDVVEILLAQMQKLDAKTPPNRPGFNPIRPAPVEFRHLSPAEKQRLIETNPAYGRIVCRCEQITEGEILEAIHSPLCPRSVDAIKRRTRAGMGRCQGGFCGYKVQKLLARELKVDLAEITKFGGNSYILCGQTKHSKEEQEHEAIS